MHHLKTYVYSKKSDSKKHIFIFFLIVITALILQQIYIWKSNGCKNIEMGIECAASGVGIHASALAACKNTIKVIKTLFSFPISSGTHSIETLESLFGTHGPIFDNAFFTKKSLIMPVVSSADLALHSVMFWIAEFPATMQQLQGYLFTAIESKTSLSTSEVVLALGLGKKPEPQSSMRHLLEVTGTSHIFVVSGMHLALYMSLVAPLFGTLLSKRGLGVLELCICACFVLLVGSSYSLLRAAYMFGCKTVCVRFLDIQYQPMTALVLAGALLVLSGGFKALESVSFQLSFAATFGIILINQSIMKNMGQLQGIFLAESGSTTWSPALKNSQNLISRCSAYLQESLLVGCAAWLFTLPLVIYHFGSVSLVGVIATLAVSWFLPVFLMLIGVSVSVFALAGIPVYISAIFAFMLELSADLVLLILHFFEKEWALVEYSIESKAAVALLYMFLFLCLFYIKEKKIDKSIKNIYEKQHALSLQYLSRCISLA